MKRKVIFLIFIISIISIGCVYEIPPKATATIAGYVKDDNGNFLSDVKVEVFKGSATTVIKTVMTKSGKYTVDKLEVNNTYKLKFSKYCYEDTSIIIAINAKGGASTTPTAVMYHCPCAGNILATVVDESNNPIEGVQVIVNPGGYSGITGADGKVITNSLGSCEEYTVTAEKIGCNTISITPSVVYVKIDSTEEVKIVMKINEEWMDISDQFCNPDFEITTPDPNKGRFAYCWINYDSKDHPEFQLDLIAGHNGSTASAQMTGCPTLCSVWTVSNVGSAAPNQKIIMELWYKTSPSYQDTMGGRAEISASGYGGEPLASKTVTISNSVEWTRGVSEIVTTPSATNRLRIDLTAGNDANGTVWFDDIKVYRKVE